MEKVPGITIAFWIMKMCAITLGETAGDLFLMILNIDYTLSSLILIGFLLLHFKCNSNEKVTFICFSMYFQNYFLK
ncbi:hypothetical protein [Flavobacterium sp. RSP15]|uniref:hypothetical protein n=1 Tax=Flavobacterium sp. RSP15 TaxID=2497485 RepID=UPI000F828F97|nr:hypothetical protein EKM00_04685 [Flavobacterium sp. RSP15]